MENYIDGFVLPVPKDHLKEYQGVAKQVAEIWKEYGALAYFEYVGDDMNTQAIRSFIEFTSAKENEAIVFGWVVFTSKAARDSANAQVPKDKRMQKLVAPLIDSKRLIFDASRMVYGGFEPLVAVA